MTNILRLMQRWTAFVAVAASFVLHAAPVAAQAAWNTTTLSSAIADEKIQVMTVANASGFTANTTTALINNELVRVTSVNGTQIGIFRASAGSTRATRHNSGATVTVGPTQNWSIFPKAGACTPADQPVLPAIWVWTNQVEYYQCSGITASTTTTGEWYQFDGIGNYQMTLTGYQPVNATVAVAGGNALTVVGGIGGGTTVTTSTNGAIGGAPSIIGGAGGPGGTTSGTGGAGGSVTTAGGVGGGTITGGAGGAIMATAGAGGVGSTTAGVGGAYTAASGAGAAMATSAGMAGAGGVAGLTGGAGGVASTGAATGGAGGAAALTGGAGGGTITGGAGGTATVKGGAGANGSTAGGSGGAVILQAGAVGTGGTGAAGKITFNDAADATKQILWNLAGATTGTATTIVNSPGASNTLTAPSATGGLPVVLACGTLSGGTATCTAAAAAVTTKIITGVSTLASNAQIITLPIAFAATTSYQCVGNDITTRANPVQVISTGVSTVTITNTTGASDVVNWICAGQ